MGHVDPISTHINASDGQHIGEGIAHAEKWIGQVEQWVEAFGTFRELLDAFRAKLQQGAVAERIDRLLGSVSQIMNERLMRLRSQTHEHLMMMKKHAEDHELMSKKLLRIHDSLAREIQEVHVLITDMKDQFVAAKQDPGGRSPQRFERLLIPTDLAENAKRATDYALAMFGPGVKSITLLHVTSSTQEAGGTGLKKEQDRIRAAFPRINEKVKIRTEVGTLIECLKLIIKQQDIDLVVMGTHGDLASDPPLFGTVTSKVIEQVSGPVLVVPKETPFLPPRRIVFTTDLRFTTPPAGLELIRSFGDGYAAQLIAILVDHNGQQKHSAMEDMGLHRTLEEIGLNADEVEIVPKANALDAINACMMERSVDLLTMVTHHGDLFCSLYARSDDEKVKLLHSHIPVLVINSEASVTTE